VINSIEIPVMLSKVEQTARACFVSVVNGFLGKQKAENYRELVDGLVDAHRKMVCSMSLKVHVLRAHLDKLKDSRETTPKNKVKDFTRMSCLSRNTITDSTMNLWEITDRIFHVKVN